MRLNIIPKSSWKALATNDSTNDLDPINVSKIKPKLGVKTSRESDIKWSNPYGDQTTHFVDYIKSLNIENSCCNH
jgi:hypothetical protein